MEAVEAPRTFLVLVRSVLSDLGLSWSWFVFLFSLSFSLPWPWLGWLELRQINLIWFYMALSDLLCALIWITLVLIWFKIDFNLHLFLVGDGFAFFFFFAVA
jgi:hypothetical protein